MLWSNGSCTPLPTATLRGVQWECSMTWLSFKVLALIESSSNDLNLKIDLIKILKVKLQLTNKHTKPAAPRVRFEASESHRWAKDKVSISLTNLYFLGSLKYTYYILEMRNSEATAKMPTDHYNTVSLRRYYYRNLDEAWRSGEKPKRKTALVSTKRKS